MLDTKQIISELGGISAVARELELTPSTVSSWNISGNIPKWRRAAIGALAVKNGKPEIADALQ